MTYVSITLMFTAIVSVIIFVTFAPSPKKTEKSVEEPVDYKKLLEDESKKQQEDWDRDFRQAEISSISDLYGLDVEELRQYFRLYIRFRDRYQPIDPGTPCREEHEVIVQSTLGGMDVSRVTIPCRCDRCTFNKDRREYKQEWDNLREYRRYLAEKSEKFSEHIPLLEKEMDDNGRNS